MTSGAEIIELLSGMLAASRAMVALAREENWDALAEQEINRRNAIARLQTYASESPKGLPSDIQTQANILIQEIGHLDGETIALTEGRMAEIGQLFKSAEVSKRLSNAYQRL